MARFILVYTHPTEGEQRFELATNHSYRIGSRPDNDIVIDQKDVSRRHAVLRVQDGSFHITDLDSKNGTFINGAKTVSETFTCGDMVHLSSARIVIIEVGTGSYPTRPDVLACRDEDSGGGDQEDTQKFRSEASMEDVVSLLETTASAVRRGALADPLSWAVDHLGFDGAVVLYCDENNSVAMVSSAGDLGQLARNSTVLTRLAIGHNTTPAGGTRVRQVSELGEKLLVVTVGSDHVLVVRYAGQPPAIGDLRSLIAAVSAVLGSGKVLGRGVVPSIAQERQLRRPTGDPLSRIVGLSPSMVACKLEIEEASKRARPVVVVGERGSGRSLAARAVHDLSVRAAAPFVVIDLEGVAPELVEDRLLIAGEGLTAADIAQSGTLVFDHVAEMPIETWETVLGVLRDRSEEKPRVMLILNQDRAQEAEDGALSQLRGSLVKVPNLCQRRDDIHLLVSVLSLAIARLEMAQPMAFSRSALDTLAACEWPGNVTELRSELGSAMARARPGMVVDLDHLSDVVMASAVGGRIRPIDIESLTDSELSEARNAFEDWFIRRALDASNGKQTEAAKRLGISRAGLFKKMKKLGVKYP